MKYVFAILLLLAFAGACAAQVCGYSHAKLFVTDNNGTKLRDVKFAFFRKGTNDAILNPRAEVRWSDYLGAHQLRHGLCGEHRDVRLLIEAKGYETLERIIDLPFNWPDRPAIYEFQLIRKTSRKSQKDGQ